MSLAVLVPLIVFSLFSLNQFEKTLRSIDEERIMGRARSVSANVDREVAGLISTAGALSTAKVLEAGNYAAFYDQAKEAMTYAHANVLLLDLSLRQLVNTRVSFGTPLPKTSDPETAQKAIGTGQPHVSDIFFGKVAQKLAFNVTIPVIYENKPRYILIVTSEPGRIKELLQQQQLPEGWFSAVSDRNGVVVATTHSELPEGNLDRPWQHLEQANEVADRSSHTNVLGQASVLANQRSARTGWTATVWAPQADLEAPLAQTWRDLYSASLMAIVLSALLAYLFSLPLANLIRQTLNVAKEIGKSPLLPPIATSLREGKTIGSTLAAANIQLLERQREAEEGKALLDTLLEHVPDGITIVGGPDMRVIANSKKAVEWIGKPVDQLKVLADDHAEAYGIWFRDGLTRPQLQQLPLYRASRYGEKIEGEYFTVKRPDGKQLTIEVSVNPVRDAKGHIIGAVSCWRDVTQRFLADKIIADNEKRLKLALGVAGMAIVDMDLRTGVVTGLTNSEPVLGVEIKAGDPIAAVTSALLAAVPPNEREKVEVTQRRAMATVGPFVNEFRLIRPDGSVAWIETRGETLADEQGNPIRFLGANVDITVRKRSEEHLRLVMRELTHRAKNLLAVILAIASNTARHNTTVEKFLEAFSRRIQGLAASHDLLVKTNWTGAPLDELVRSQLAAFDGLDGSRVSITGPTVILKTEVLQSLGLALHELATNASKYGALSVLNGTVRIEWSVAGAGGEKRFRMSWAELGGPRVRPPKRRGFGYVISESSLAAVLNGAVTLDFSPKGVIWTVDAPMSAITPGP